MAIKEKRRAAAEGDQLTRDPAYCDRLIEIAEKALISPCRLERFMRAEDTLSREELLRLSEDGDSFLWVVQCPSKEVTKGRPHFPVN